VEALSVEPLTEANVAELVAFLDRVDQTYFNHPGSDALGFLGKSDAKGVKVDVGIDLPQLKPGLYYVAPLFQR